MESLRESILERAKHKREKDKRVNDRMMQSKERKDNSSNALDAVLVVTKTMRQNQKGETSFTTTQKPIVVRQPNTFKSERPNFSKPRFSSQVDVNNVLSEPVTPHYFPKVRESASAKPHHVNAFSSSRNNRKESYGSNDMAQNYYLEEAKKKTQDKNKNLKPREMPSAKTQHTSNACTPTHRRNNQTSRNWHT
nr:hypothetical protein [Tanacetum cinerariifolium]